MKAITSICILCVCMVACTSAKKDNMHSQDSAPVLTNIDSQKAVDSTDKATMGDTTKTDEIIPPSIQTLDTTLKWVNYEFVFSEITKQTFEQNLRYSNPTHKKYHQLCNNVPKKNYPTIDCADTVEALQLKKHGELVQVFPIEGKAIEGKKNKGKRFAFGNRKQFRLTDNLTYGGAGNAHYFREMIELKDQPYFVFFRQNWEGANYLMVSGNTGKNSTLNGMPQISPNQEYVFTTPYDAGTYHNFLGVELWQATLTQLTKVFSLNIDVGTPWRSYWLNDQTIMVEIREGAVDNYTYRYGKINLRKLPNSK
ncbi:hypothetical protein [uncultured Microscilla sp.]|uniref:hypothetical protein n=1 Tax=uncultured Microscilla sp. TaxID=432653 RepID=UPI0026386529|nr:hypothetical protein [uncultured Microscilla sp.]